MRSWRFVANQNSTIFGINDAGIETFTANMNRSLVREAIQNSLDAVPPDYNGDVYVEFSMFDLATGEIPDVQHLHAAIKMCCDSNKDEPDTLRFFENADKLLSAPTIKVLRISDYHTVGLEGSDTCAKGTTWSRLVKESGSSNKDQSSGGSFGIGKSAAFACSDLRTVFYSSLDRYHLRSNIGVAKLVSFRSPTLGWTTGVGYYSEDERFVAIPELAALDRSYTRDRPGTDIYIMGMHQGSGSKESFIKAVLLDFLVSIVKGKLVVKIQDEVIDKTTLAKYMSKLDPYESEQIKALLDYYHLLTSNDPSILKISLDRKKYGQAYGFNDGECTLLLKEGEGYNRKILITRKAGMRIFEQDRISGSIEFTGILMIDGPNMNETFKTMEVPSHDAWEPGRCRHNVKFYTDAFADLRRYLRAQVKENFGKISDKAIDAFGASDFLPDKIDEQGADKLQKTELSTRIKALLGQKKAPTKKKTRQTELVSADPGKGPGTTGDRKTPTVRPASFPNGIQDGDQVGYKEIPVKKRLICLNAASGDYSLTFIVPTTASKGKLTFMLSGEQSDFDLPVLSAKISEGKEGANIQKISGHVIYLENLKKGTSVKVELQVDFDNYCMMEVDYFANKK